jgi:phosphocarrier protein FPr
VVGLVIVSHSATLAEGVAELARGMGADEVKIAVAGGLDTPDRPLGTDAVLVHQAIEEVWSDDGVLVLMDLGSAVLSAEMALEFLDEDRRGKVLLCDAPLVEGAVAAAVASRVGEPLERVAAEARGGLAPKAAHLDGEPADPSGGSPAVIDAEHETVLAVDNPHGLHARPAARLVQTAARFDADVTVENVTTGRGPVAARSLNGVATLGVLQGHEIRLRARGPQSAAAMAALIDLAADHFGDPPGTAAAMAPSAPSVRAAGAVPEGVLAGLPASPGIVLGPARHVRAGTIDIPREPSTDPGAERSRLEEALAATRRDIAQSRTQMAAAGAGYEATIFDAHLLFLDDPALLDPARAAIAGEGRNAADAWDSTASALEAEWSALDDEYLRERAVDLHSVAQQVLAHLAGVARPALTLSDPGILIARDLTPADTAALDRDVVLGLATAGGGPTSHSALLARSLGIPAVVGLGDALLDIDDGVPLLLDGEQGTVTVAPSDEVAEAAERRRAGRARLAEEARVRAAEPAATRDGVDIEVAANLGSPDEAPVAVDAGADAVGLLRTEFLFLSATTTPGEDDQEAAYRAIAEAMGSRPVTARTLDAGSDKPLAFLAQPLEANPALGVRGLRLGLAAPDVLTTQLRALLRVAADHPLRIMFPMVASIDELRAARRMVDETREDLARRGVAVPDDLEVGIMVEVPAAALAAPVLATEADFFSIGTNDLAQYTLAADRTNERVAGLADALHPAVLELIRRTAEAGSAHGRWVGVCGELGGDLDAVPILLGLGVRELSMAAPAIPLVKAAIRELDLDTAADLAAAALRAESAAAVRRLVHDARR